MNMMKKVTLRHIAVAAMIFLLMGLLCSCSLLGIDDGNDTSEITDPNQTEVFVYNERMSISLPGDFYAADLANDTFTNGKYLIRFCSTPKSRITPQEGYSFPTLKEYYEYCGTFKDKLVFYTENGLLCADYDTTPTNVAHVFSLNGDTGTQLLVFFETEDRFYVVSFYAANIDYATVKTQALDWAGGIESDGDFIEQPPLENKTDVDAGDTERGDTDAEPDDTDERSDDFVNPETVLTRGQFEFVLCDSKDSYIVVGLVDDNAAEIIIPSMCEGFPVVGIGERAFYYNTKITNVTIPDSVTHISEEAFRRCSKLKSIILPDSIKEIGKYAFAESGITNIIIPNNVTSIKGGTFYECSSLTDIVIPDSVTKIGDGVFNKCNKLTSITIPESVTEIGEYVFKECSRLTSITLGDSVTSIGSDAFKDCESLERFPIPKNVTRICSNTFSGCFSLTSIIIPENVTRIDDGAFEYCHKLVEVYNFSSLKIIQGETGHGYVGCYALDVHTSSDELSRIYQENEFVFYMSDDAVYLIGYDGIETDLVLPNLYNGKTYSIYKCAFYNKNLTSVVIPDSVTSVSDYAFSGCSIRRATMPALAVHAVNSPTLEEVIITSGPYVGNKAFWLCTNLTNVTISEGVTSIGEDAFRYCENLTSINIPNTVVSIGVDAFKGCTKIIQEESGVQYVDSWVVGCDATIAEVVIKSGTRGISDHAFKDCTNITSINIPSSVMSVGEYAFHGCEGAIQEENGVRYVDTWVVDCDDSVKEVVIRPGTKGIAATAFSYCENLTNITIPESVAYIGNAAFYNCRELVSVVLPMGVTSIGDSAFSGCRNLTNIILPESVKSIGAYAFAYCDRLKNIVIPNGVTNIEEETFWWCGLETIIIPDGVIGVGRSAFGLCFNLSSVVIPDSVTIIDDYAFSECGITNIVIPKNVTSIGEGAFSYCLLADITFAGTKAEWDAISKGDCWNQSTVTCTIHCIDGDIQAS